MHLQGLMKMNDIKSADNYKSGIKTKDLYINPGLRMKQAYIKTKNLADTQSNSKETSAQEYASDELTGFTERSFNKLSYDMNYYGKEAFKETSSNIRKAKFEYAKSKTKGKIRKADAIRKKAESYSSAKDSSASFPGTEIKPFDSHPQQVKRTNAKTSAPPITPVRNITANTSAAKSFQNNTVTAGKALYIHKQQFKKAEETVKNAAKRAAHAAKAAAKTLKAAVSAVIAGGWVSIFILIIVILFGAVLAVFSTSGGSSSPVSEEVNAYTSLIQIYAQKHGIPEYVDLIKAVMMQESGGRGNDPMQASECGFNTQYPHGPNSITDPEYSIDVGIQNIAYVLNLASVQNPIDIPNISLALQAYNYGTGYIYWALDKDGGYTPENAIEFSNNMAALMGWSNYGDSQYVPHVLRYYPLGGIMPGLGSESIVQVALSQVGNIGGQAFWSWYGFNYRVEWCACYVSWCSAQCGYIDAGLMPKFAYCPDGLQWFMDNDKFMDRNYTPAPGTIIFFDWQGDGVSEHVGIVEYADENTIHTVEGNISDSVVQKEYPVGSYQIMGYGII